MEDTFKITNDQTADWAVTQIHEAEEERDRLVALALNQIEELKVKIEDLNTKCDNDTAFLKSCLFEYFGTVKHKETKTQESYKLLSGSLIFKKPSVKIAHNDDALIQYLENNDGADYIKIKKTVDWAEFKKQLAISDDGGAVIDKELGVVLSEEICSVEEVPASFNIKY